MTTPRSTLLQLLPKWNWPLAVWVGLALITGGLYVALFPIHLRTGIQSEEVLQAYRAVGPMISLRTFANLVLIGRYAGLTVFLAVAGLIVWRRPRDRMGLVVALMLITLPLMFQLGGYSETWLVYPKAWRPVLNSAFTFITLWVGLPATIACFFLFPTGRAEPRWLGWAGGGLTVALYSVWLGLSWLESSAGFDWAWLVFILGTLLLLGLALWGQVYRYNRVSAPADRRQTRLVVVGLFVFVLGLLGQGMGVNPLGGLGALVIGIITLTWLPVSLAISMLRYRLWGIEPLLNRALVYGALTVAVVGVYALIVGGLGAAVNAQGSPLLGVLATGLAAVLFQPLRQRVQRGVNRLLYGERDDPATVLNQLGGRLEAVLAPEAVLPTIIETVAHTLKLPYAAIDLWQAGAPKGLGQVLRPAAEFGRAPAEPEAGLLTLPLAFQGEAIGQLRVAPRGPGEPLSAADRQVLAQVARQAGAAVHAVRLTTDLRLSRERLVSAREEERRRLRRDLHDGLGTALAALHLQAGGLRRLIDTDPPAAQTALAELRTDIRAAVAEIRRLVYDLRPPALDELGLAGALRALAAQLDHAEGRVNEAGEGGVQVLVEAADTLPPLPAAVEVAAYRIAQEALSNVARHAQAQHCWVRVWLAEGLNVEVSDDGLGLPVAPRRGVGLRSMPERAAELGGRCQLAPRAGGGTTVSVWLPLLGGPEGAE